MKTKLLSLLLALAMALSFATVFAAEESAPSPSVEEEIAEEISAADPEIEKTDLKKQIVPRDEVPDLIDYDLAVAEKYVCRAYWEETSLNEVVFLKSDGSLARHVFSFPVKYEADGEVYDKKPELQSREILLANKYRYELSARNDTALYCGENVADGFLFQGEDLQVNLRPITETEYNFLRGYIEAGEIVTPISPIGGMVPNALATYDSVALTGTAQSALTIEEKAATAALYALSTTGQQASYAAVQDTLAVVPSYTGFQLQLALAQGELATTLYFELDPAGLTLARPSDTLLLLDDEGNTVGIVGDLLSEQGMAHDVEYAVTPLDNGNYLLSATLPRSSSGSAYTMSVTLNYNNLEDATIYTASGYQNSTYPTSKYLWVGYYPSTGFESALVRPKNWTMTQSNLPNQRITSAQITLRDVTVTSAEAVVACHAFVGNEWTEQTACWNTVNGSAVGAWCDEHAVSSSIGWNEGYYYTFDITGLVQCWYEGTANPNKGVIFTWKNPVATEMEKGFASVQYSTEAYRPKLIYEYAAVSLIEDGVYYLQSGAGGYLSAQSAGLYGGSLLIGSSKTSSVNYKYRQLWRVKHVQNGYYTIRPYFYTPSGVYNNIPGAITAEIGYSDEMLDVNSNGLWKAVEGPNGRIYLQLFDDEQIFLIDWANSSGSRSVQVGDIYGYSGDSWTFEAYSGAPQFVSVYGYSNEVNAQPNTFLYSSNSEFNKDDIPLRYMLKDDIQSFESLGLKISICSGGTIDVDALPWSIDNSSVVLFADIYNNIAAISVGEARLSVDLTENGTSVDAIPVFDLCIVSAPEVGYNYIRNALSGKYVDSQYNPYSNIIGPGSFHGLYSQVWDVQQYGSSYYTISQSWGGCLYYLSVQNAQAYINECDNIPGGNVISDEALWEVSVNHYTGNYILRPKDLDEVMGFDTEGIVLREYNHSAANEWIFSSAGNAIQGPSDLIESIDTFSSVMSNLNVLYEISLSYASDPRSAAILTLQFIRRGKYNGFNWESVAGSIDEEYVDYVYNNFPELYDYFTVDSNENLYYQDPNAENYVDFVHLCATLNGLIVDSGFAVSILYSEDEADKLSGWAGDLQTLCEAILQNAEYSDDYEVVYEVAYSLIGHNGYKFSMPDLLSDVDSENIYEMLDNSVSNLILAFQSYYNNRCYERYTYFCGGRTRQQIFDDVRYFTSNDTSGVIDWPLLYSADPTETQADAIAAAFTDFIWERIQNE